MAAHGGVLGRHIEGRDLQAEAQGLLADLTFYGVARARLALLALHSTGAATLSALSRALRMQPHGLASLLDELPLAPGRTSTCVLHVCRYAQADAAAASSSSSSTTAAAGTQGTEAHHDRGLLTVVVASEAEGLEVQSPTTGAWQRVVLAPGEAAVFGGLSLEWATGGVLPAALHCVVPLARGRTSLCYKLQVRPDAVVDVPALLQRRPKSVPPRYHAPKTGAQLMEVFAASHPLSVNALVQGRATEIAAPADLDGTPPARLGGLCTPPDAGRAADQAPNAPPAAQPAGADKRRKRSLPDSARLGAADRPGRGSSARAAAPSCRLKGRMMRITCANLAGTRLEVDMSRSTATADELLGVLEAEGWGSGKTMRLCFKGERFGSLLADAGIEDGDTIYVFYEQCGD